jgi:hypothetical protein
VALTACGSTSSTSTATTSGVRHQDWVHVPGTCGPEVEGAVFSRSKEACGGAGSTFDSKQIYISALLADVATDAAPCPGIATGSPCYRMWYVGNDEKDDRRIGYAVSPDGVTWARVPGPAPDGSVLEVGAAGAAGAFDSFGVSAPTVVKDGDTFRMWYTGLGKGNAIQGVGLATSTDGLHWTRVPGPDKGGAVLRESKVKGTFDQDELITAHVIKDVSTDAAPCPGVATGNTCYRMWYEGVDKVDYYRYHVGYAVSPDGVAWTKVKGNDPSGAVLSLGGKGEFDEKGVGVPYVVKDGALFHLWYEAVDAHSTYTIGHAVSADGSTWARQAPNTPALTGADDPGTYKEDSVWTASVLKTGDTYRMWYTVSDKPNSQRFGPAQMVPGSALASVSAMAAGSATKIAFTTTEPIPAGGSVLVTLPPERSGASLAVEASEGFGASTAAVEPTAVTDASALGVARAAVVVRVTDAVAPGPKSITLTVPSGPAGPVTVQTFDQQEVLEHGTSTLL